MRRAILATVVAALALAGCSGDGGSGYVDPQMGIVETDTSIIQSAHDECQAGTVGDEGTSLFVDMEGEDEYTGDVTLVDFLCITEALAVPESTMQLMMQTRAMDGRQSDEWDELEASWSYHPDDGLDVIVTEVD